MLVLNRRVILQSIISVMLFTGLAMAAISIRLFADGKMYYDQAELARSSGEPWRNTVMHYENAAKTWFPGNPYPERAIWQLSIIARSARMRGDSKRAAYIWEVIRRSAVSQRHVFQPMAEYVNDAHEFLNRGKITKKTSSITENGFTEPAAGWSVLLWVGLVLWIVAATAAIFSAERRPMVYLFGGSLAGALLWILAAALA